MTTIHTAPATGDPTAAPISSARGLLLVVAIVLGGIGNLANILFGYNGAEVTIAWLTDHQSAWAAATYGTALNLLGILALLVAVCVLARRRGAGWATASLVAGSVGAALYAVSAAIPVAPAALATQTAVRPAGAAALLDHILAEDLTQPAVAFPGFLLLVVAQLTITVALIRSRSVPLWVPILFLVGCVLAVVFAGSGLVSALLAVPQLVAMVAIGWYARRH